MNINQRSMHAVSGFAEVLIVQQPSDNSPDMRRESFARKHMEVKNRRGWGHHCSPRCLHSKGINGSVDHVDVAAGEGRGCSEPGYVQARPNGDLCNWR